MTYSFSLPNVLNQSKRQRKIRINSVTKSNLIAMNDLVNLS